MNIYWVVVDCVRNYQTGKDDRDKLDIMYQLEKDYVSFDKMIVSAPSSVMSISTSLSSIPAYYIAGNYIDFRFDNNLFWSLSKILEKRGYSNHAILNARESREKLSDLVTLVDRKFWKPNLKHSTVCWKNSEVTDVFNNLFQSNPKEPNFYLLWYNARRDPNISDEVSNLHLKLKTEGHLENSIFILTSDHGYPDPKRGLISDGFDLKKVGLPHDIILTDDNINVPFIISYPGSGNATIECQTSCEDILPSILDLLEIDYPKSKSIDFFGRSFLPLINNEYDDFWKRRFIRSDARFSMQSERITSLRRDDFKYIIQHDNNKEELYEFASDPFEVKNLASLKKYENVLNDFRNEFLKMESDSIQFLKNNLINQVKQNKNFSNLISNKCCVINFGESYFYEIVLEALYEISPSINIIFISSGYEKLSKSLKKKIFKIVNVESLNTNIFQKFPMRIEIVDDPLSKVFMSNFSLCKYIKSKQSFRINPAPEITNVTNSFLNSPKLAHYKRVLNRLFMKKDLYFKEPSYLLIELKRLFKILLLKK